MKETFSWEKDAKTKQSSKVGKAVFEIMSKPQELQEVGETLEAMTPRYYEELFATVYANKDKYDAPFYITVLRKKEPWAINILRQWFIARQTCPTAKFLRDSYPNHDHDVWKINFPKSEFRLEWTLPTAQDSRTILQNRELYNEDLVKWIMQFNAGTLNGPSLDKA